MSWQQVCKKSSAEIMRACKITQITMMRGQYYSKSSLPFSFSCSCEDSRVPPLKFYYDIFITEDLHCLKAVDRNFVRNGGTTRTHSSLCSRAGVSEQIDNNVLFWLSFENVSKTVPAFRISGVLQLAKTGPPVQKTSHSFAYSPQMLWWLEGFTHLMASTVPICIFWPRAECRTFWLEFANFEARKKKIRTRLSEAQTRKLRTRGT